MIERIIAFSAKNRALVLLVIAALCAWAIWCVSQVPLDAIPDLSDTQVIVYTRWDRPPKILEDQVTYPIVSALLGAPKVKDIRAFTDYGYSYVYVIFEDGVDPYWARSRVNEYLSKATANLPSGVKVELGPDATGVGWVYEYALVDETGKHGLAELRSFQDWKLRFALQGVPGVAEVASIGGSVKSYQIVPDPSALAAMKLTVMDITKAVQAASREVGARLIEDAGRERMVTIKGYVHGKADLEDTVVARRDGGPIHVRDVAKVTVAPDLRRGIAELDGRGEAVGGIVVMRQGENALKVIEAVKERISQIQLPEGVKLKPVYDRSDLIKRAVATLRNKLIEEMFVVSLVVLVFLLHVPSAIVPILTLPIGALLAFIPMKYMGVSSNIMSLGGIAIAIGAMVDASIVVVENTHKRLAAWQAEGRPGPWQDVVVRAMQEVGRSSFFSLVVIAVAFVPIFALEGVEGRLFHPLALTKNLSMIFGALLAITLDPAVRMLFTRFDPLPVLRYPWLTRLGNVLLVGKIHSEESHPISKRLFQWYGPVVDAVLRHPKRTVAVAALGFAMTLPLWWVVGREFMPPLNEGSILYMPTTPPGISSTQAGQLLQWQDRILKGFPEVASVFGKAGRAETATDPAPFSMMETVIVLKPERDWREKKRWYSFLPDWMKGPFRFFASDRISWEELVARMNEALSLPGQVNAFTLPIKGRIDMLTTGVRTPVGVKIYGDDLAEIERIGSEIEKVARGVKGTRSVYAERVTGGYFVNFVVRREELARYGLSVQDVQETIMGAVGGETVAWSFEGRERYPISVRYPREWRDSPEKLRSLPIPVDGGRSQVPLGDLADVVLENGPGMIRDENGRLAGYVFIDTGEKDLGGFVADLKKAIVAGVKLPAGAVLVYSGQYELMERVEAKMRLIVPAVLLLVFLLIWWNTGSVVKTGIVMLAVPFSLAGAILILWILGYNLSLGSWSGIIALLGVDAETGIFMLLYIDLAYAKRRDAGLLRSEDDLRIAIHEGAVNRIRPKLMTVLTMMVGLLPILWASSHEAGADVMKRIAAPMVGGIAISFLMELCVYPAVYFLWKRRSLPKDEATPQIGR